MSPRGGGGLGRARLERRESGLRLGIELLALEGDAGAPVVPADARSAVSRVGAPPRRRNRRIDAHRRLSPSSSSVVGADDDRDVLVVGEHDVGVGVELLHVISRSAAAPIDSPTSAPTLLNRSCASIGLSRYSSARDFSFLCCSNVASVSSAEMRMSGTSRRLGLRLQLVADRVADLARLDLEDDDVGLVRPTPLDGRVPVGDVLDLEPVWRQHPAGSVPPSRYRVRCKAEYDRPSVASSWDGASKSPTTTNPAIGAARSIRDRVARARAASSRGRGTLRVPKEVGTRRVEVSWSRSEVTT